MENIVRQSDTRSLPEGWVQHYEPSKKMWYYVQTSVMPPKVSFIHPSDIILSKRQKRPNMISVGTYSMASQHNETIFPTPSPIVPPQPSSRSTAQELYASSSKAVWEPMTKTDNLQTLSTAPIPQSQSPTNPTILPTNASTQYPRTQTGPSRITARPISFSGHRESLAGQMDNPILPLNHQILPPGQIIDQTSSSHLQRTFPGRAYSSVNHNISTPVINISSDTGIHLTNQYGLHRSASSTILPQSSYLTNDAHSHQHAYSYSVGLPPSHPNSGNPQATPHILTTLRPPPNTSSTTINFGPARQPPPDPPKVPTEHSLSLPPINTNDSNHFNQTRKILAQATLQIGGSLLSQATGVPSSLITGIGDVLMNKKFISMLKVALSKKTSNVGDADLQAVMCGQANANYQAVINALVAQQQQQQSLNNMQFYNGILQFQQPSIDYQALIAEIQRLRQISQTQQNHAMAMQQQMVSQAATISHLQTAVPQQQSIQVHVHSPQQQPQTTFPLQQSVQVHSSQHLQQPGQHTQINQLPVHQLLQQQGHPGIQQQSQALGTNQASASLLQQTSHQQYQFENYVQQQQDQQSSNQPAVPQQDNQSGQDYFQAIQNVVEQQTNQTVQVINHTLSQLPQPQDNLYTQMFNQIAQSVTQQQQLYTDLLNQSLSGGGGQIASFDPSTLNTSSGYGTYNSGNGILDAITQSLVSGGGGGGIDTSGIVSGIAGQGLPDPGVDLSGAVANLDFSSIGLTS